jgi:carbamoyl-phosphate synthase small subunit
MAREQDTAGWSEPAPTALLVLADGTVLEGIGLGATGRAVGEVCFNTAMTGYEEILTDPSYAGQIITFTFPHIGNVGTNEEDIETVNLAATLGARGVILHSAITQPSNYRATRNLDAWLKSRGVVGLAGIDTRALTALIREKGMPNAVIAHEPSGRFDLEALKREAREWPGMVGMDLVPMVTTAQRFTWDETPWHWGEGYGHCNGAQFHVVAIDYGIKRNILRQLAGNGCKVTVVPAQTSAADILALKSDGIFLSNGPGDPAATGEYAVPVIRSLIDKLPTFGICLGHQMLALAVGARTVKMHQRSHHRQSRDHLDEPRLRGRPREPAGECSGDAYLAIRRFQLRAEAHRPAGVLGPVSSRGIARTARQPLFVRQLSRADAGFQGPVNGHDLRLACLLGQAAIHLCQCAP